MSTVQSKINSGDSTAHISANTENTVAAFNHAFGEAPDTASRMATVLSAVNASLTAVQDTSGSDGHMAVSPNSLSTPFGSHANQMSVAHAPIATSRVGDHQIMVDVSQWNGLTVQQQQWVIIHDSFHAEAGWRDWKDSAGQKYMHFGPNGTGSPVATARSCWGDDCQSGKCDLLCDGRLLVRTAAVAVVLLAQIFASFSRASEIVSPELVAVGLSASFGEKGAVQLSVYNPEDFPVCTPVYNWPGSVQSDVFLVFGKMESVGATPASRSTQWGASRK